MLNRTALKDLSLAAIFLFSIESLQTRGVCLDLNACEIPVPSDKACSCFRTSLLWARLFPELCYLRRGGQLAVLTNRDFTYVGFIRLYATIIVAMVATFGVCSQLLWDGGIC